MSEEIPEDCPGIGTENAGKASACEGCPNQSTCASGETPPVDPNIQIISDKFANIKKVIVVLSGKGGVGKSTVSAQIAFGLAQNEDLQVGLLDIDICGPSQHHMMGMKGYEVRSSSLGWQPVFVDECPNLAVMSIGFLLPGDDDPIIWRGPRKSGIIRQFLLEVDWGTLDYLVIDTPPGTSDEHLSIVSYLSKVSQAKAVIVTTPQEVSLLDVRREVNFCHKTGLQIEGVIENMSGFMCTNCNTVNCLYPASSGGALGMCQKFNLKLLGSIPWHPTLVQAGEQGVSLYHLNSPLVQPVTEIINNILGQQQLQTN